MLNRRHLRVKVMQNLFAWYTDNESDLKLFEKKLEQSIDEVYAMYIWVLALLTDVADCAEEAAEKEQNKFKNKGKKIEKELDLANNRFIQLLRENKELQAAIKKYKADWSFDPEIAERIFAELRKRAEYREYLEKTDRSFDDETEIVKYIFRKLLLKDAQVIQAMEDRFINYSVDHEVMKGLVARTFKNFNEDAAKVNKLERLLADEDEDRKFAKDLFKRTIANNNKAGKMIEQRTRNWDKERIALMDAILMKMAVTEFLDFTMIPVKVTLNEYLELSKEFSTPKSSVFINGILDNILADLRAANTLVKTGRGLVDE